MDEKDLDHRQLEQVLATLSDELAGLKNTLRNGNGNGHSAQPINKLIWALLVAVSMIAFAQGAQLYRNMKGIDDTQNAELKFIITALGNLERVQGQSLAERNMMRKINDERFENLDRRLDRLEGIIIPGRR